ncbi:nodulation protein L [Cordyceps militaris CM01]|uniref:Nodulation protein L n=1 Tax=Cordyceps militaris (strain CM01) TaxID=983644 RepID=G3JRJ5_CORMM|nr:nodulation protein L [Cordyceps militaris CM01]EGX88598.1 nodulation protein L [Cordyceps militaris CM01]
MAASSSKNEEILALAKTLKGTPQCDEYDRMISGMLYNPLHPILMQGRHKARGLAYTYNNLDPNAYDWEHIAQIRTKLLQEMLGSVGEGTCIETPFLPDYGCNIIIGQNCFMNFGFTVLDTSLVIIGDRVQMGPNVHIYTAGHETSVLSRIKFVEFGHPIRIEDDCWIGGNVIILPGVTIGRGCTVGAGAVVTKSLPPYSVALGAPAKVVKTMASVEEERADPKNPFRDMPDRV